MTATKVALRTFGDAVSAFERADWTFADAKTNSGVHGIHPYPAKFIPQIPGTLLDLFHPFVAGPVLDPFCGSGTTLVECQLRGIPSVGVDLNPIATLISTVKTNPPPGRIAPVATKLAEAARLQDVDAPAIPNLDHWFKPEVIRGLARLRHQLRSLGAGTERDALNLALSRIIVRVSNQDSDTRYAAVDRSVTEEDVYTGFVESARTIDRAFEGNSGLPFRSAPCQVHQRDILSVTADQFPERFGMVITSPPYPNAYEYWLYHKYRMYWLELDPILVRSLEIGARPNYFRKNGATKEDFEKQMARCFDMFWECTREVALVCMLVGRSVIRGEHVDNAALVTRAAEQAGFRLLTSVERRIPRTRKAFNPVHGAIESETLLVLMKGQEVAA